MQCHIEAKSRAKCSRTCKYKANTVIYHLKVPVVLQNHKAIKFYSMLLSQHNNPDRKLKMQIRPTPTARLVLSKPPCPATQHGKVGRDCHQCFSLYHNRRIRFKSRHLPAFLYLLRYDAVANTQNSLVMQEQAIQSTKQTMKRGV